MKYPPFLRKSIKHCAGKAGICFVLVGVSWNWASTFYASGAFSSDFVAYLPVGDKPCAYQWGCRCDKARIICGKLIDAKQLAALIYALRLSGFREIDILNKQTFERQTL